MKGMTQGKWIWYTPNATVDTYGEFLTSFRWTGGKVKVLLSVDGDYALYINGNLVATNQYADFEHYKIYDELDVTSSLKAGENIIAVEAWYFGETSQKYRLAPAGLIFEGYCENTLVFKSDEGILARESRAYRCGRKKRISSQLGLSFFYDSTKADDWKTALLCQGKENLGFQPAVTVEKRCCFYPRPNEKLRLGEKAEMKSMRQAHSGRSILVDLGAETVGLPYMQFTSPVQQKITVFYGERLSCGNVERFVGGNDYSFEYIASAGENKYLNPFLRLGCRYMQVYAEEEICLQYLGVLPQYYPVTETPLVALTETDRKIQRLCRDTLKLCMLEHYVDCPWREQGLYAFDSRNQMLAGYYAFGNYAYAKSNLLLMSMDDRADGLLSITAPGGGDLVIPSFSLYYVLSVCEYLQHSGEDGLETSIFDKLTGIMRAFTARIKNGLVYNFAGEAYWHFYDWSDGLTDYGENKPDNVPDLVLNCLYAYMLDRYAEICRRTGKINEFGDKTQICKMIKQRFYDVEKDLFAMYCVDGNEEKAGKNTEKKRYTSLGNALAVLCGAADGDEETICEKILQGGTTDCSLSMRVFVYDALLQTDEEAYAPWVLEDIRKNYTKMLDAGATATWETIDGEKAFDGSGSLCHGWSAIPVYYYHRYFCPQKNVFVSDTFKQKE
ncbi:MAG: family 78 glycoside hydrolase catalytic domain [Clostridia bacterium]|nr:family 78 glycoside hydrolase catalytic domain [Clostridia bacterium]